VGLGKTAHIFLKVGLTAKEELEHQYNKGDEVSRTAIGRRKDIK
jgi:hypothetical protein